MSDSNDATATPIGIPFSDFLETRPPGASVGIADLMVYEKVTPGGGNVWRLNSPVLKLHCASDSCDGERHFRYSSGDRRPSESGWLQTFLVYQCSNCHSFQKMFALRTRATAKGELDGNAYKYGEAPPFGPLTPPRLLKMLDRDRDLFMKGRRCESQGLGIGAFVYYRRVVEHQRTEILGQIINVARTINAPLPMIELLEQAQTENQFSKSLDMVKDAIPESLRIQGHNPLTLLHDNLSTGLHAQSDAECLEIAGAIRIVLAELAERISAALKDEAELTKALGRLLNKNANQTAK